MNDKMIIAQVVSDHSLVDEDGVTYAEKWMYIQNVLGVTDSTDIMHEYNSDDFLKAYQGDDEEILNAFLFLAQLRYHIFYLLKELSTTPKESDNLELGMESSFVWAQKIYDRALALASDEEVVHTWLN